MSEQGYCRNSPLHCTTSVNAESCSTPGIEPYRRSSCISATVSAAYSWAGLLAMRSSESMGPSEYPSGAADRITGLVSLLGHRTTSHFTWRTAGVPQPEGISGNHHRDPIGFREPHSARPIALSASPLFWGDAQLQFTSRTVGAPQPRGFSGNQYRHSIDGSIGRAAACKSVRAGAACELIRD